jgi:hypothetical protein
MARYVLLAFDKDSDADAFVEMVSVLHAEGKEFLVTDDPIHEGRSFRGFIRGMWQKPTIFCQCSQIKGRGWTRGKKRGWWVCTKCARPSVGWARGDVWYTALGTNMLPITNDSPEYRGPMHKQHPGYSGPPVPQEVT